MTLATPSKKSISFLALFCISSLSAIAAPPDRISGRIDPSRSHALTGQIHNSIRTASDVGPVDPSMAMNYVVLAFKTTAKQQAELDALLAEQQNPSSKNFHKWLTPEEYGNRFGLSTGDESKVSAWLVSQGLSIAQHARGRNWIAFNGTADKMSKAFHTSFHRFEINGEKHYANTNEPEVPEALAGIVAGFNGLHDFRWRSNARPGPPLSPDYTTKSGNHYLSPEDWSTIYDVTPLAQSGFDGTGVSIAIVGQSDILLSDLHSFKTQFGLPANDPKVILYNGIDPGTSFGPQFEANLDLEWAGAIAPKAQLYYVNGQDAFAAALYAVDANLANIISISYGGCESLNFGIGPLFSAAGQQANAQGTTILSSTGDTGSAGGVCDGGALPYAVNGLGANLPSSAPEVTAVGGTQFNEGSTTYWKTTNDSVLGSVMSYIPEAAWNESGVAQGLLAGSGGLSLLYPKPTWQQGPGVPAANQRSVPDVALAAAASHDGYLVYFQGVLTVVGGTSASSPSLAGVVALLNQYQVKKGFQAKPGLGNINPELYRLAQAAPSAFHDVTAGSNSVPCLLGTQDCVNGSYGYSAAPGYDLATGLGSIDAYNLVTLWNTAVSSPSVALTLDKARVDLNGTVTATASVSATAGKPTGTVSFSFSGVLIGSVPLSANGANASASITFPAYLPDGTGTGVVSAVYSGDTAFSSAGATASLRITVPTGASGIVISGPAVVFPGNPDAQGLTWQTTLTLSDLGSSFPSLITGFTIDGQAQSVSQYFPSVNLPAGGTVSATVILHNIAAPLTHTFAFTGIDSSGLVWNRQIAVSYSPYRANADFELSAAPLTISQTNSIPGCPYPARISMTDESGFSGTIVLVLAGNVDVSPRIPAIFGTTQLGSFGTLTGTVCFDQLTAPSSDNIVVGVVYNNFGFQVNHEITLSFAAPPVSPIKLTPSSLSIGLSSPSASQPSTQTLQLNVSDKTQPWTLTVLPNNRTGGWLTVSPMSGVGPATITLTASGTGYGIGAYRALLVFQSANASPQSVTVPVMFVLGGNAAGTAITSVGNAASYQPTVSPGSLVAVIGSGLAGSTQLAPATFGALPNSLNGVFATVNGYPAPIEYLSPTQINLQIPYETGAGPAVVGINNNGSVAGYLINIVPAAPGIFADASGNLVPNAIVKQGVATTLYLTGAGDMSPTIATGTSPTTGTPVAFLPQPLLPLSVTVAGTPVFVTFAGIPVSLIGVTQVNFIVPAWVPTGTQPLVVTVNGVASNPVNIQVNP